MDLFKKCFTIFLNCIREALTNTVTLIFKTYKNLHWMVGYAFDTLTNSDDTHAVQWEFGFRNVNVKRVKVLFFFKYSCLTNCDIMLDFLYF